MAKQIKQVLLGLGILSGTIILLFVAVLFYLKTDHALRLIEAKVTKAIPGRVLIEKFRFSLVKGEFELKNVLVKGRAHEELAGFDRLFIRVSWYPLLKGDLTVSELIIEKPRAVLQINKEGNITLIKALLPETGKEIKPEIKAEERKKPGIPINIVIEQLRILNGIVSYEASAKGLRAVAYDIDMTADANFVQQSGNIELKIGKGILSNPRMEAELEQIKLSATFLRGRIEPLSFQAGTALSMLNLSGNICDLFNEPLLDLTFDLAVSLPEVIKSLKIEQPLTGEIAARLSAQGSINNPQLNLSLDYRGGSLFGNRIDEIDLDLNLKDRLININNLRVNVGSGDLNLQGEVDLRTAFIDGFLSPIRNPEEVSYKISLNQKEIKLENLLAGTSSFSGTVSADISVCGKGISPQTLSATMAMELSAEKLAADPSSTAIDAHLKAEGSIKQGVAKLEQLNCRAGDIKFWADGQFNISSNEIAAKLGFDAPDIAGIRGILPQPDILAENGRDKIGFAVADFIQKLHDISGRLEITPQLITIDSIKGRFDTGSFDMTGKIGLKQYKPVKVSMAVNAHSLPLEIPDTMDLLINSNLQIEGTEEKSIIKGDILILEGTYFKDVNLSLFDRIKRKKRKEALPPQEIRQPFLKNMELDIYIKRRNPFLIENNLAQLDINPDLRVSGKLNNPIITGRAKIESGTITYRKKTFIVKKGTIDFLNPYKIEPAINIESEVQVRTWTIYLNISGTQDNLELKFTSNPYEEDGDILSLLLFGKTTRELIKEEGGTSQSTAQMLAEMISATFGDDVKDATGLDILDVETQGDAGEQSNDRIKVTLGKELSRRMLIKYALESKNGEIGQRAIAEYKLLESILLSGFQDSRGIFGGELRFRLEFR